MIADVTDGTHVLCSCLRERGWIVASCAYRILDERTAERRVVRYSVQVRRSGDSDSQTLVFIGKFFNDDTGSVTFRTMCDVRCAVQRARQTHLLSIPKALLYDARRRILIREYVSAPVFEQLTESPRFPNCILAAGRALAVLHHQTSIPGEATSLRDHVNELIRPHPFELARHYPEFESVIREFITGLEHCDCVWQDRITMSPIHRDFQLRQLLVSDSGAWLIDWDSFALGDAAFDVAYFIVYLRTHLDRDRHQIEHAVQLFLRAYLEHGQPSVVDRLPVYECFNYVRRACRRLRLQDDNWEAVMYAMLRQAERLIPHMTAEKRLVENPPATIGGI